MSKTDKIRFFNIVWDVDPEDGNADLPMVVEATFDDDDYVGFDTIDEVESMYADKLTKMTGFCVKDFCYKPIA